MLALSPQLCPHRHARAPVVAGTREAATPASARLARQAAPKSAVRPWSAAPAAGAAGVGAAAVGACACSGDGRMAGMHVMAVGSDKQQEPVRAGYLSESLGMLFFMQIVILSYE